MQVCEDYEDEEREKYNEELTGIKRRFSHPKVKRKWVSIVTSYKTRKVEINWVGMVGNALLILIDFG